MFVALYSDFFSSLQPLLKNGQLHETPPPSTPSPFSALCDPSVRLNECKNYFLLL